VVLDGAVQCTVCIVLHHRQHCLQPVRMRRYAVAGRNLAK
jgi:hypothetical protein